VAALLITTQPATPIFTNRISPRTNMSAHLLKTKATLLDLVKLLPEAHIAEESDFIAWGRQFVDVAVSQV
jgi:hypothetical protein